MVARVKLTLLCKQGSPHGLEGRILLLYFCCEDFLLNTDGKSRDSALMNRNEKGSDHANIRNSESLGQNIKR